MITRELAIKMYQWDAQKDEPFHVIMKGVNDILKANNSDSREFFPEEDIRFCDFMSILETQREKDLVFISEFFTKAYRIVFITIQVLKEEPPQVDISIVNNVYNALIRLGKEHLLTDGVKEAVMKKYFKREDV